MGKTIYIKWVEEEYIAVFKEMQQWEDAHGELPALRDYITYNGFQTKIRQSHRRVFTNSTTYSLRLKYFSWKDGDDSNVWMKISSKKDVPTSIPEPAPVVIPEPEIEPSKASDSNEVLVVTNDIMVEMSHMFDDKLAPLMKLMSNISAADASIKKEIIEDCLQPSVVASVGFTEDDIRNIVRSEIEKIFGTIGTIASEKPITTVAPANTAVIATIEPARTTAVESTTSCVKQQKKLSIFVLGMTTTQIDNIQLTLPTSVTVRGLISLNENAKAQAKNSDFTIVSKFSSHSAYESLKSICDNGKVFFVSGGTTMVKRKIVELADKAILRN